MTRPFPIGTGRGLRVRERDVSGVIWRASALASQLSTEHMTRQPIRALCC